MKNKIVQILSLLAFMAIPIVGGIVLTLGEWKAEVQSTVISVVSATMMASWIYINHMEKWHTNFVFSALMVLVASVGTFSGWATAFQVFSTELSAVSLSLMVVSCLSGFFCYKNMFVSKK
jgi:hypothetical protein